MKKINMVLICVLIALVSLVIGFLIGKAFYGGFDNENSIVGTYRTSQWNGAEAVIVLQKDKTMICPNGTGTWYLKNGKVYLEYSYFDYITKDAEEAIAQFQGNKVVKDDEYYIKRVTDEATIVGGGLMYRTHFFERIQK